MISVFGLFPISPVYTKVIIHIAKPHTRKAAQNLMQQYTNNIEKFKLKAGTDTAKGSKRFSTNY